MHDNGRKRAQGALRIWNQIRRVESEAGTEQAGSLQIRSTESTELWKLWKVPPYGAPP